jgi:hypothetical protein
MNFAALLARCGYSLQDVLGQFKTECRKIPAELGRDGMAHETTARDAANLLTRWYTNVDCLNPRGRPIPLPLQGPAPSIEALARQVGSTVMVTDLRDYLTLSRTIQAHGDLYVPIRRYVLHPPKSRTLSAHCLRIVAGLLRTAERNASVERSAHSEQQDQIIPWWLEGTADGEASPNETIKTMRYLGPAALKLLEYAEDSMSRRRASGSGREKTVPLSMVVFMFEGMPGDLAPSSASRSLTGPPRRPPRYPASTSRKVINTRSKARSISAGKDSRGVNAF